MGGKGAKVQVTEYYMSQHFGVCSPVDALLKIIVKEKEAWAGWMSGLTALDIDKQDLFGGVKKEGGVKGTVHFLPGAADQVLPDVLAQRLGRANGADAPGYRGLASIFFIGNGNHRGFYWTANNPYLPGVWATVRRAPIGLTPGYALIARPGSNFYPYEQVETSASVGTNGHYASGGGWIIHYSGSGRPVEWFDAATMTLVGTSDWVGLDGNVTNIDLADDGTAYFLDQHDVGGNSFTALYTMLPLGTPSGPDTGAPWLSGPTRVFDLDSGDRFIFGGVPTDHTGWLSDGFLQTDTQSGQDACLHGDGTVWGLFEPLGSSNQVKLKQLAGGSASFTFTAPVTRSNPDDGATFCHVAEFGLFFVVTDGKFILVNDTTGAVIASGVYSGSTINLPRKNPSARSFWSGYSEVSLEDGSVVRSVNPDSWLVENTNGDDFYDVENNAIWVHPQFTTHQTIRLLDRGDLDANPAHVIYEALTNTDWGMGSPSTLIDVDSFEDAGVVLYNEPLGLSLIWTRQSSIQDFIQEVLDHIQGALFVDPQTGLLTLKLIRGDYDVGTLPTIDPSNATLTNFGRKLWGEIVNEISVTWTNPDNEQDETVTVHDLASITTQGGIISDSRNYYGVRYAALAQRLAARDLRSAGAPLAACDAEIDRTMWFLRPASVLLLDWPEYGLVGLVMRVTAIDYGKPGDMTLKVSLIEDVFGLDAGDYVDPPSTSWEDTSAPPSAMSEQEALTLPYYMAKNAVTSIEGAAYPEVIAGALGASANADVFGFELWGEVTLPDGSTEWQSLASLNILGRAELAANLAAEATSTGVTFSGFIGSKLPQQAGFAIIGGAGEEGNELALITAASSTYSLSRGVLDTIPRAWPSTTPVWFIDGDALFEDSTARSVGEIVEYRLRTRTSQGMLTLYAAPLLTETLTDRPWLPSRPANVKAYGVAFSAASAPINALARPNAWVTVTWANRDRLTEDSLVLAWTDANVTPETGQTTKITVMKLDGTVLATHAGLSGTSYNVPDADFGTEEVVIIRTASVRTDADGTFESLQHLDHWVIVGAGSGVEAASGAGAFSGAGVAIRPASLSASGAAAFAAQSSGIAGSALAGSGMGALSLARSALAGGSLSGAGSGAFPAVGSSSTGVAGVRASRLDYVPSNTLHNTINLPTGSQAGDTCFFIISHGFDITFPSDWVPLSALRQTNLKGAIAHKVLTSGDISTGSISVTLSGSYTGEILGLTMIGNLSVQSVAASNNNSGASSRTLTTDANPVAGDYLILFGGIDVNASVTSSSLATLLQSNSNTGASGLAKYDVVGAGGAQSATINYGGSPTGDYQALIAIKSAAVSTLYTNSGGTGNRSASITVTATNITAGGGAPGDTVDGSQANSYWWTNATGNGTGWLTFDFGVGVTKVIDQFLLYQDNNTNSHGTWRFEGSNNNSTWTQCGVDFTLRAGEAIPVPNTTAYRYYRLRHMSGSRSQTPFIHEFEFKIA